MFQDFWNLMMISEDMKKNADIGVQILWVLNSVQKSLNRFKGTLHINDMT